jgi:two-component system sensor histidine kinase UhpB
VLADLGLLNSLSSLASDLTARTGIPVHRDFLADLPELRPESELVIYRVAQEALTNVARHARASRIELGLSRRGDSVVLLVTDDGIGGADPNVGAGIQGMKERAQMVGGRCELSSRRGSGTKVRLEIPVGDRTA